MSTTSIPPKISQIRTVMFKVFGLVPLLGSVGTFRTRASVRKRRRGCCGGNGNIDGGRLGGSRFQPVGICRDGYGVRGGLHDRYRARVDPLFAGVEKVITVGVTQLARHIIAGIIDNGHITQGHFTRIGDLISEGNRPPSARERKGVNDMSNVNNIYFWSDIRCFGLGEKNLYAESEGQTLSMRTFFSSAV